jgi:hypothetical protein
MTRVASSPATSAHIYPSGGNADFRSRRVRHFGVSCGLPDPTSASMTCCSPTRSFSTIRTGRPSSSAIVILPSHRLRDTGGGESGWSRPPRRAECISGRQILLYSRHTETCLRMSVLNSKDATLIAAPASKSPKNRRNRSHASARAARCPAEALAVLMVSPKLSRLLTSAGAASCYRVRSPSRHKSRN